MWGTTSCVGQTALCLIQCSVRYENSTSTRDFKETYLQLWGGGGRDSTRTEKYASSRKMKTSEKPVLTSIIYAIKRTSIDCTAVLFVFWASRRADKKVAVLQTGTLSTERTFSSTAYLVYT